MKRLLFLLLFLPAFANAQHSDLYIYVRQLITDSLKAKITLPANAHAYRSPVMNDTLSPFYKFGYPLIAFDKEILYLDQLDTLQRSDIAKITVLAPELSTTLFGQKGRYGTIYLIASGKHFKKRLRKFSHKDLRFVSDGIDIIIDKNMKDKFIWKQLIQCDPLLIDSIKPFLSRNSFTLMAAEERYSVVIGHDRFFLIRINYWRESTKSFADLILSVDLDWTKNYFLRIRNTEK